MKHLIKRLEKSVAFAEKEGENMDDVSWGMQEGILISYNEAKVVIEALKAFKISSNPVLDDVLLEQSNWLMANTSLEVEKIVDLKMHLQKHFI